MIPALLPLAASAVQSLTGAVSAAPAVSAGQDFGAAMSQAASNALHSLRGAEATSIKGVEGKASVQQVTESVMSAEQTLQTALTIRDKAVAAWQQIGQMQI
jgi:flagellar hook-basal body complex protein FliE